jgi:NAD-dependent SIR2 family protein deacetylase
MSIELSHLESIIKAAEDDSLSIFVGAGVSKSIESEVVKVPTWSDLINDLKLDLSIDYELDYLKVAQLYYLEFGEHSYYKKVKSYFPDTLPPSKLHEVIFNLKPHSIITTNWDNILETTILENAYIYDVISCDNDLMKSRLDKKLIKMHGDFRNHNIVFKEDDYINYEYNFPLVSNY